MKSSSCLASPDNKTVIDTFQELYEQAQRRNKPSQASTYRKILQSLRRYPLPLRTGSQALLLEGVGKGNANLFGAHLQVPSVTDHQRESHRQKVLEAMVLFSRSITSTSEGTCTVSSKGSTASDRKSSVRLTPGTSAWTILLSIYLFAHQFENEELRQTDISKAVDILVKYDHRCKIASWKAASTLTLEGYLTSRSVPAPFSCKHRKMKSRGGVAYRLTERGRAAGETILCTIDAPLARLGSAVPSSSKDDLPASVAHNDAVDGTAPLCMPGLRDRLLQRIESTLSVEDAYQGCSLLTTAKRLPDESLSQFHYNSFEQPAAVNPISCPFSKPAGTSATSTEDPVVDEHVNHGFFQKGSYTVSPPAPRLTFRQVDVTSQKDVNVSREVSEEHRDPVFRDASPVVAADASETPHRLPIVHDRLHTPLTREASFSDHGQSSVPQTTTRSSDTKQRGANGEGSGDSGPHRHDELLSALLHHSEISVIPSTVFQVVCLVDFRETTTSTIVLGAAAPELQLELSSEKHDTSTKALPSTCRFKPPVIDSLNAQNIAIESTGLPIGDFAWICRFKKPKNILLSKHLHTLLVSTSLGPRADCDIRNQGYEQDIDFMLPYIVERKTIPDMVASIIDGRYEDQKFRLLRSPGIKCVIFLIEGSEENFIASYNNARKCTSRGLHYNAEDGVPSAIASTQLVNGFHILFSADVTQTAALIVLLHNSLVQLVASRLQQSDFHHSAELSFSSGVRAEGSGNQFLRYLILNCPLRQYWEKRNRRLTTVMDVFGKQLRSIEHLGERTVDLLLNRYEVPASLRRALERWPTNTEFYSHLLLLSDDNSGDISPDGEKPAKTLGIRNPLTTRIMTSLRELYAPSTVAVSLAPACTPSRTRRRRKQQTPVSGANAEGVPVKKRVASLRKKAYDSTSYK